MRSQESGFTLVELIVATALLSVVLAAILSLSITAERLAPREEERAAVIQETQVGLHRMTRELRQAKTIGALTDSTVTATLVTGLTVSYDCSAVSRLDPAQKACLRSASPDGGELEADQIVIERLVNTPETPVFDWDDSVPVQEVRYVSVRVAVPARGDLKAGHEGNLTLQGGFYLRNMDASASS